MPRKRCPFPRRRATPRGTGRCRASPRPSPPTTRPAGHAGDSTLQEFRSIVDDLEPDQQQEVVALLWVGRGDFGPEEWQAALEEARDDWTPETADYLIAHPLLADYLRDGLESMAAD